MSPATTTLRSVVEAMTAEDVAYRAAVEAICELCPWTADLAEVVELEAARDRLLAAVQAAVTDAVPAPV